MEQTTTIVMTVDKDCKHVVRYKAVPQPATPGTVATVPAVDNVYLSKTFANPMPMQIEVTVKPHVKPE